MGIISIKSTDNLFWLGRYVERVFTTLKMFTAYYDVLIDVYENAYVDFLQKLGIPNTYSYKQEFIADFLFNESNPNSVMSTVLSAYDNAVIMRNELSSETMSYIQLAVEAMQRGKESTAPILKLQEVFDCIFAFWGAADDYVESETTRNILKFGRSVERIDLYTRFSCNPELIRKEFSILLNRLYKVGIDCNITAIDRLMKIILEKDDFEADKFTIQDSPACLSPHRASIIKRGGILCKRLNFPILCKFSFPRRWCGIAFPCGACRLITNISAYANCFWRFRRIMC